MKKFSFIRRKNFLFLLILPIFTGFFALPVFGVEISDIFDVLEQEHIQVSSTVEVIMPENLIQENQMLSHGTTPDESDSTKVSVLNIANEGVVSQDSNIVKEPTEESVLETIEEQDVFEAAIEPEVVDQSEPLDFTHSKIMKMKAIDPAYVAVLVRNDAGEMEIWFYDFYNYIQRDVGDRIGTSDQIIFDSPLGAKGRFFFWRGENTIFAYDSIAKKLQSKKLQGENGKVCFDECAFDVILRNNEFYFFSDETGEVFSDDDSNLRLKLYLLHLKNLPESREDLIEQNFVRPQESL